MLPKFGYFTKQRYFKGLLDGVLFPVVMYLRLTMRYTSYTYLLMRRSCKPCTSM